MSNSGGDSMSCSTPFCPPRSSRSWRRPTSSGPSAARTSRSSSPTSSGFTPFCDRHQDQPELIVHYLQQLFETWEEIASGFGVQKIKTIGDAFMAAAGLLEDARNPVLDCVRCGLRMIEATRRLCDERGQYLGWNLRVGVHAGPVVAGVLGRRQYLYDLWGDAVNTAARLESHGKPGCVNLSLAAWQRVASHFRGEFRGCIEVKGKGVMELIHLDAAMSPES